VPRDTARRALSSKWFGRAIRIGHAAKGVVFGMVGLLAARVALGWVGDSPDFAGALEHLADQPLDLLFLVTLTLGLLAYAAWRFAQGLAGMPDADGALGLARRAAVIVTGLTYAGFAVYASALIIGVRRQNDGLQEEAAMVMDLPGGVYIVGALGAGVAAAGLYELFVAFTGRYRDEFAGADMHPLERHFAAAVGWWGHAARGVIYCAAGFFALRSAVRFDPDDARGFADTIWEIGRGDYGDLVLGFVAAGLISFGLYSGMLALHRHIPEPGESGGADDDGRRG
jgi:hypothetical protein